MGSFCDEIPAIYKLMCPVILLASQMILRGFSIAGRYHFNHLWSYQMHLHLRTQVYSHVLTRVAYFHQSSVKHVWLPLVARHAGGRCVRFYGRGRPSICLCGVEYPHCQRQSGCLTCFLTKLYRSSWEGDLQAHGDHKAPLQQHERFDG